MINDKTVYLEIYMSSICKEKTTVKCELKSFFAHPAQMFITRNLFSIKYNFFQISQERYD